MYVWSTYLSIHPYICPSTYPSSFCLSFSSTHLHQFYRFVFVHVVPVVLGTPPSIHLSIIQSQPSIYPSINVSFYLSTISPIYLNFYQHIHHSSIGPSVYRSICLSFYLSFYPTIYLSVEARSLRGARHARRERPVKPLKLLGPSGPSGPSGPGP